MPEEQPILGNRWTIHAVDLLSDLGWNLRGDMNQDIPCTIQGGKKSHGIDAFLTYFDPYQSRDIGLIIEAKYYSWNNINQSFIQKSLDKLFHIIECAPYSEEFNSKFNFDFVKVNTGILMIWSHDDFDKNLFENYLQEIKIPRKHKALRISVLNNFDILKLYSIERTIKELISDSEEFDIYYPSYSESDSLRGGKFVSLEYFHSKFIFGKMIQKRKISKYDTKSYNIAVIFYFDKLTFDCLEYMYLALRRFQLIEEEILICYYDDPKYYRGQINEFERTYSKEEIKITFKPMIRLGDVPWELA